MLTVDGLGADPFSPLLLRLHRRAAPTPERRQELPEAEVDHGITVSHPGHVTIATGLHPAHHGIVDAAFAVPEGALVLVDALGDAELPILGAPELEARRASR